MCFRQLNTEKVYHFPDKFRSSRYCQ